MGVIGYGKRIQFDMISALWLFGKKIILSKTILNNCTEVEGPVILACIQE